MTAPPASPRAVALTALQGQVVGLDTAPLIYYIEQDPVFLPRVEPFFMAFDQGAFTIVTSVITLLEVLVGALRRGNTGVISRYRAILLGTPGLEVLDVTTAIAEEAARIRATYRLLGGGNKNIMTPDAIQLATARLTGASYFFTGEDRLPAIETLSIVTPRTLLVQLNPSAGNDG